jgi:DNA-binding GntR family transcriptional regulator
MATSKRNADMPERVADEIFDMVSRGVLAPGLQLRQMDLAKHFKSSRVPVREALKLLSAEGVVEHDPNRGFFVAPLSSDEAKQLYRIRHLLEAELLRTLEWPNKSQLAEFHGQLQGLEMLLKGGKSAEWVSKHRDFYRGIFRLSPQKFLIREVLRLLRLTDRYRSLAPQMVAPAERKVTPERHLVAALAAKDRERLLRTFEEDRARLEQGLLASLEARGW